MNKLLIKESVIPWLVLTMKDADEYSNVKIIGTFGDNNEYPLVTCAINKERPLTNWYSGLLAFDHVRSSRTVLYKSLFNIQLNVYADIDDETNRIAEILVDKIREKKHTLRIRDHGDEATTDKPGDSEDDVIRVEEIRDDIVTGDPKPVNLSGVKKFMCQVIVPIKLYEVKTITRS